MQFYSYGTYILNTSKEHLELKIFVFSFLELQKEGMWLVMFYAPWCGHCRTTEPAWMEVGAAMKEKKSNVKVARVDATK